MLSLFFTREGDYGGCRVYDFIGGYGVSLGDYLFCGDGVSLAHEYGHHRQSLYLGWLYIPAVGFPSIIRCIYCNLAKKGYTWYHGGYPERWADELGKQLPYPYNERLRQSSHGEGGV